MKAVYVCLKFQSQDTPLNYVPQVFPAISIKWAWLERLLIFWTISKEYWQDFFVLGVT